MIIVGIRKYKDRKKYPGGSIKVIAKSWCIRVWSSFSEIWMLCNPISLLFVIFFCKDLDISVTVYAWGHHFPLQNEGQLELLLWCSTQSDYLHSGYLVHTQTFLPKVGMTSSQHHLVTYQWCGGFWMMTCTSQLHQGWRYKRMNARGKGFPEILGVELIGLN